MRSLGASPIRNKMDETRSLFSNGNALLNRYNSKAMTKKLANPLERNGTQKFFTVAERETNNIMDRNTNFLSTDRFRDKKLFLASEMQKVNENRDQLSINNFGGSLNGSLGKFETSANTERGSVSSKLFKNELAKKKIEYFIASAKNFIFSSVKVKKFIENNRTSDVQYALNLFEIDRENMEKSLRHLEQETENFSTQTLFLQVDIGVNGILVLNNIQKKGGQQKGDISVYAKFIEEMQDENNKMKMKLVNEPLKSARDNIHIAQRYKEELDILENKLYKMERQFQKSQKKCSDRKSCIRKLYTLMEEKEKESEYFQSELESLNKILVQKCQQIDEKDAQLEIFEKKTLEDEQIKCDLVQQRNERRENMEDLTRSISEVQQKLKVQCREEYPTTLTRWKAVRDNLLDRLKILGMQREENEKEIERVREEYMRERERNLSLEGRLTSCLGSVKAKEEKERELEEVHFVKEQIERRLEESEIHYENLIRKLEGEVRRWQDENENVHRECRELKERAEFERIENAGTWERRMGETEITWERRLQQCAEEWEKEVLDREEMLNQKQMELENNLRGIAASEKRRQELQTRLEAAEREKEKREEEFDSTLSEQKKRIQTLTEEMNQKKKAFKDLDRTLQEAQEQLSKRKNEGEGYVTSEMEIKERLSNQRQKILGLEDENSQLRRERNGLIERVNVLESRLSEGEREIRNFQESLQNNTELRLQLQGQMENMQNGNKKQIEALRVQVTEGQSQLKVKETQLLVLTNEQTELRENIQALRLEGIKLTHKLQQSANELSTVTLAMKEWRARSEESASQLEELRKVKISQEEQYKKRVSDLLEEAKQRDGLIQNMHEELKNSRLAQDTAEQRGYRLQESLQDKARAEEQLSHWAQKELEAKHARVEELTKLHGRAESEVVQLTLLNEKYKQQLVLSEQKISQLITMNREVQALIEEERGVQTEKQVGDQLVDIERARRIELQNQLIIKDEQRMNLHKTLMESESQLELQLHSLEDLQRESEFLNVRYNDLQERLNRSDEQREKLQNEIKENSEKELRLQSLFSQLQGENKTLQVVIEQQIVELKNLRTDNLKLKECSDVMCDEQANMQRQFERIKKQLEQSISQNTKYEEKQVSLQQRNESLREENEILKQDRMTLEQKLLHMQNENDKNQNKIESVYSENEQLKSEMAIKRGSETELSEKLNENTRNISILKEENTQLKLRIEQFVSKKSKEKDILINSHDELVQSLEEKLRESQKEVKELSHVRVQLTRQVETYQSRSEEIKQEMKLLQEACSKYREEIQGTSEQLSTASANRLRLEDRDKSHVQELERLKQNLAQLRTEKQVSLEEVQNLQEVLAIKEKEHQRIVESFESELRRNASKLEDECLLNQKNQQSLKNELAILREEQVSYRERLRIHDYELPILTERCENYSLKLTELSEQKYSLQFQHDVMRNKNEQLQRELDQLSSQMKLEQDAHSAQLLSQSQQIQDRDKQYQNTLKLLKLNQQNQLDLQSQLRLSQQEINELQQKYDQLSEENSFNASKSLQKMQTGIASPFNKLQTLSNSQRNEHPSNPNQTLSFKKGKNPSLNLLDLSKGYSVKNQSINNSSREYPQESNKQIEGEEYQELNEYKDLQEFEFNQGKETLRDNKIELNAQKKEEDIYEWDNVLDENIIMGQHEQNSKTQINLSQKSEPLLQENHSDQCQELQKQVINLKKQLELEQKNFLEKCSQLNDALLLGKSAAEQVQQLKKEQIQREEKINSLETQVSQKQATINTMNDDLKKLYQKQQDQNIEIMAPRIKQELEDEIMLLKKQIEELKKRIEKEQELENELDKVKQISNEAQIKVIIQEQQFKDKINNLNQELLMIKEELLQKSEVIQNLSEELIKANDTLQKKQDEFTEKSEQIDLLSDEFNNKLEEKDSDLQDKTQELNCVILKLQEINQQLGNTQLELKSKTQELHVVSEGLSASELKCKGHLDELTRTYHQIEQQSLQIAQMSEEVRDQNERITALQEEIELGERQYDQQSETMRVMQDKMEGLSNYMKHLEEEIHEQKTFIAQLEGNLEKKRKQLQEADDLLLEREQILKDELHLKMDYISKLENNHRNKAELSIAQSQQVQAEQQAEILRLKHQLGDARKEVSQLDILRREHRESQRQLKEAQCERERLEMDMQTFEDDLNLQKLSYQDVSIKLEVLEMKSKNYFSMLLKILLAFDSDIDENVHYSTHSLEDLLSIGLNISKQFRYSQNNNNTNENKYEASHPRMLADSQKQQSNTQNKNYHPNRNDASPDKLF